MAGGRVGGRRRRWSGPAVIGEKVELDGGDRAGKVFRARGGGGSWGRGGSTRQDAPAQLLCF